MLASCRQLRGFLASQQLVCGLPRRNHSPYISGLVTSVVCMASLASFGCLLKMFVKTILSDAVFLLNLLYSQSGLLLSIIYPPKESEALVAEL